MRIGLAGAGPIGAFHARTLASLPTVDEVVVTDVLPESAQAVAEAGGLGHASTFEDLLARVDAVVIATSTDSHADNLL